MDINYVYIVRSYKKKENGKKKTFKKGSRKTEKIFFVEISKIIDEKQKVCYNVIWTRADLTAKAI